MTTLTHTIGGLSDRARWLAERRQGLGASESATVLGLSPWQSPAQLYLAKLGELPDEEESWPMRLGSFMEGLLAREYQSRYGAKLQQQVFLRHRDHPWMFATLDGLTSDGVVVEFKTASWRGSAEWGEPDTDQVPTHYLVQVQHQLEVARLDTAHVFVSVSGAEPVRYVVGRNPELGRTIAEACGAFWRCVCDRTPPRAMFVPGDHRLMHLLYPEQAGAIGLDQEVADLVDRRAEVAGEIRALEEESDRLKTLILAAMGPFPSASLPDGRMLAQSRTTIPAATVQRKEFTRIDLRVKKARA